MVQLHEECVAGKIYINNKKVHCSISVTSDRTRLIIEKTNTAADEDLICKLKILFMLKQPVYTGFVNVTKTSLQKVIFY